MTRSFLVAATRTESEARHARLNGNLPFAPAYCDYIAHRIVDGLQIQDDELVLKEVSRVQWDLHPEHGYLLTTTKTINVTDRNGRRYKITVEAV